MDEPIRSHLPNENYRRGWDETFGASEDAEPRHAEKAKKCKCGKMTCTPCAWMLGRPIEQWKSWSNGL